MPSFCQSVCVAPDRWQGGFSLLLRPAMLVLKITNASEVVAAKVGKLIEIGRAHV